jgi:hypothetical protein
MPGDPGLEDPGLLGMVIEGVKEGLVAPFAGLGERLGLLEEGTRLRMRDEFEQARLAYLSGDPGAFRATVAGAAEILPSVVPMFPVGKAATMAGRFLGAGTRLAGKEKAVARIFGAGEGMMAGFGETAGQDWKTSAVGVALGGALGGALPAAAMDPEASRIAKILDSPDDIRKKIVAIEKEWISSAGRLPREVYERAELARGAINAHERAMVINVRDIERAVDNLGGDDKLWADIDKALSTKDGIRTLDESLRAPVQRARDQLDKLSDDLIGSGFLSEKLEATYKANKGRYIHRSRQAWDDAEWRDNYFDKDGNLNQEWSDYVDQFTAQMSAQTGQVVEREVGEGIMLEALNRATIDAKYEAPGSSKVFSPADLRTRMHKKGGPEALRKMLGEYHDPRVNLKKSVVYMANDYEINKLFEDVAKFYEGAGLARTQAYATPEFAYQLSSANYGALRGRGASRPLRRRGETLYFKDQDMVDALMEVRENAKTGMFNALSDVTRYMKTVGSVVTHVRNTSSGMPMMAMQGHGFNPFDTAMWRTVLGDVDPKHIRDADGFLEGKFADYEQAYQYLLSRNVVQNSTLAGDVKSYMEGAKPILESGAWRKAGKGMAKLGEMATKLYQGSDDMWKVQLFLREKARYKRLVGDVLDDKWITEQAGNVVRDTMQVYSRVPKLVKKIRDFPLTGPFLSFPAEIVRNFKNTLDLGRAEMGWTSGAKYGFDKLDKAQREALKKIGRRRLMGATATLAAPAALATASRQMHGMSNAEMDALRETAVAPWSENSSLFILGKDDESGQVSFIDLSFMDPYNYVKKAAFPARRAMQTILTSAVGGAEDNEGMRDLLSMLEEVASRATQPEIWAGELYRGISTLSKMKAAPLDHKVKEAMYRTYRALAPGTAISFERFVRGLDSPGVREVMPATTKYGQRFNPAHEALSMALGMRITSADLPRVAQYKGREYFSARTQARRLFTTEDRNKADRSMYRIRAAKQSGEEVNQKAGEVMLRHIENLRTLGMTNEQIMRQLNAGGVSKAYATDLIWYGKIPPIKF